jgi:hypothetical protein
MDGNFGIMDDNRVNRFNPPSVSVWQKSSSCIKLQVQNGEEGNIYSINGLV